MSTINTVVNTGVTVTFTPEQMSQLRKLHSTRTGQTLQEIAARVVERGLYDLSYRTERNRKQYAEFKAYKQSQK